MPTEHTTALLVPKLLKYQGTARVSQTLGGLSDTILVLSVGCHKL